MRRVLCLLCPAALLLVCGLLQPASGADPPTGKPKHTNRLARETSPYLLLHAHNPVDWYPWGEEALAKAKKEKKLIFLSVGYSSCYWCHVMERQSFMDEEIAKYLNENFVCIKVDREERPDIDEIYMTSLQVYHQMVGSRQGGGWPLSMFLTPDAEPIGGGTYFPPRADKERGLTGFLDVIHQLQGVWKDDPKRAEQSAAQIAAVVKETLRRRPPLVATPPGAEVLKGPRRRPGRRLRPQARRLPILGGQPARAQVPRALEPGVPVGSRPPHQRRQRPEHAAGYARRDGRRRNPRPPGRRISPLQHRPLLADSAL